MRTLNQYLSGILSFVSLIILGLFLYGCSTSSTAITATWANDEVQPAAYKHIVVAPLIADRGINALMENELALSLAARDVKVDMGRFYLPQEYLATPNDIEKETILDSVKTSGADAILTVSIINKESETRYQPGSYAYTPYTAYPYYGTFWGYYDYWAPTVYEPGYYETTNIYYLETNLFDVESEKLIWSAQTETYDPATIKSFTDDFSRKIAKELNDDNII